MLSAYFGGHYALVIDAFKRMLAECWRSTLDLNPAGRDQGKIAVARRPFVADVFVSHAPTLVHAHEAEGLGVSLMLLSLQPDLPTGIYLYPLTIISPKFSDRGWLNRLSYHLLEIA